MASSDYIGNMTDLLVTRLATLNPNFEKHTYLEKFGSLNTNLDRVNFVYKDLKKYNLFPKFVKSRKNDVDAKKFRELGNEFFGWSNYKQALKYYTFSISEAKSPAVAALAFANRSACLYKMGKYQACVIDIERALAHNYPNNLKPKLMDRRKKAQAIMGPPKPYHEEVPYIPNTQKNAQIQSAKKSVAIKTNKEFGRHVVATRHITIGEIICVEKPYACSYLIRGELTHCHGCLELCYNLIPCENCSNLLFCSTDCRDKAYNTYHKYECDLLENLHACEMTHKQIHALRVAILARGEYQNLDSLTLIEQEMYRSDRYKEIHNLMPGTEKRSVDDLLGLAVTASIMFHFLLNTSFFNGPDREVIKRNFKEVLLLQLQIVPLNKLEIMENVENFVCESRNVFAHGLYSFASLFNYSCCCNVELIYYGNTVVLKAINTIKAGQQCFVSSGVQYHDTDRYMRQKFLEEYYFFNCKCQACKSNWHSTDDLIPFKFPLFMDLEMNPLEVITMEMDLACSKVKAVEEYLPRLLPQLKRCEMYEPWGNTLRIKQLIVRCYRILGNKNFV